jgi:hypothetical protein
VEQFFAIPIIGVQTLDGYRKKPLHPSYKNVMVDVVVDTPPLEAK